MKRLLALAALFAVGATLLVTPRVAEAQPSLPFGNTEFLGLLAPGKVRAVGWAVDPMGAAPVTITVQGRTRGAPDYSPAAAVIRTTTTRARPDVVRAFPGAAPNSGFDITVDIPGGRYDFCVFAQVGIRNTLLACQSIEAPGGNPQGSLDAARANADGTATVSGWAIDPDTASAIDVHLYANGRFVSAVRASGNRPDVARLFASYGPAHGYSAALALGVGTHQICAYGINTGVGWANTALGCRAVTITDSPGLRGTPFGSLDAVRITAPRTARVNGWVIDRDSTGPVEVHLYANGKFAGATTTGITRSDVARAYPGTGVTAGYSSEITLGAGTQRVCAYAINVGAGFGNPELGCRQVTTASGNPFGSFDSVSSIDLTTLEVLGWAADPDTAEPTEIHVYVNGEFAGTGQADQPRSDVGAAFPIYGNNRGYRVEVPYQLGRSEVCVYAINSGPGTASVLLGCRAITVEVLSGA